MVGTPGTAKLDNVLTGGSGINFASIASVAMASDAVASSSNGWPRVRHGVGKLEPRADRLGCATILDGLGMREHA